MYNNYCFSLVFLPKQCHRTPRKAQPIPVLDHISSWRRYCTAFSHLIFSLLPLSSRCISVRYRTQLLFKAFTPQYPQMCLQSLLSNRCFILTTLVPWRLSGHIVLHHTWNGGAIRIWLCRNIDHYHQCI